MKKNYEKWTRFFHSSLISQFLWITLIKYTQINKLKYISQKSLLRSFTVLVMPNIFVNVMFKIKTLIFKTTIIKWGKRQLIQVWVHYD